jgi:FkbM family methyltransferase
MKTMTDALAHLKSVGFDPKTVVDVGVAHGTPPLYAAFPGAYFFLFEPVLDFERDIQSALKTIRGEYQMCALGATSGTTTIFVSDAPVSSSLMHRGIDASDPHLRHITIRTLDDVFAEKNPDGPILLKTDCQSGDLDVIRGGAEFIQKCDAIIMEVGMFRFWSENTPDFADTVIEMKTRGFVPYDFFDEMRRPLDGALGQLDAVFVKESGPFRKSHTW